MLVGMKILLLIILPSLMHAHMICNDGSIANCDEACIDEDVTEIPREIPEEEFATTTTIPVETERFRFSSRCSGSKTFDRTLCTCSDGSTPRSSRTRAVCSDNSR